MGEADVNGETGDSHLAVLRDALSNVDPTALTRVELLMMADVLGKALAAFGDPPPDLGDQQII